MRMHLRFFRARRLPRLYPLSRSVSNKMNDTEHGVPRERERYLAFSDTRGSIHPSTRQRRCYYYARTSVLAARPAFVFPLKIISIFAQESGRDRRGSSLLSSACPTKFIIAGVNEHTFFSFDARISFNARNSNLLM